MNYTIVRSVDESFYPDVLRLIHESFEEHKSAGLDFTCSSYTLDDLKHKVLSGFYFIAVDENNEFLGITSVRYNEDKQCAYENISAVSPHAKCLGIGSALYKERTKLLKSLGCKYLLSDTSVNAKSSVKWHLKKCKCSIIGFESFPSTNYYSYIFKEDYFPVSWLKKRIVYNLILFFSFIQCVIRKKKDGNYTILGHMINKVKNIF